MFTTDKVKVAVYYIMTAVLVWETEIEVQPVLLLLCGKQKFFSTN